ncbi:Bax inhibitor-1/YccA family membrane protein [Nocardioides daejeonensis]|uniref:Bax inhibitor-1/YccA family protein n=1 Tax=Nocardioides daejeonensis TaxID=1046556 RepID=UPI000D74F738|nr:Bax inhibitor-1/YccA family protein [Nocardioides daejeonensis]
MQSNNPVFNRSEGFNGQSAHQATLGYDSDPSQWGVGVPGATGLNDYRPMTIDSAVQKTAISLGIVIVTAFATWMLTPEISDADKLSQIYMIAMLGAGAAFILSLVNSFKKVISPALVMLFAAAEGVALGGISKSFEAMFYEGIVMNAVLGTFAAFAGTLAAYKFLNIQVGDKFRRGVIAGMFGMVGLGLLTLVLSLFGIDTGLFGMGALGLVMAVVGLVLGVFMLILDFDFVERGVAAGLPEAESWRAAFGLTVSLVWIYTNLLRILAILNQD